MLKIAYTNYKFLGLGIYIKSLFLNKSDAKIYIVTNKKHIMHKG